MSRTTEFSQLQFMDPTWFSEIKLCADCKGQGADMVENRLGILIVCDTCKGTGRIL